VLTASRLNETVYAANTLLYHAVCGGQELPSAVREPIVKARAKLERGEMLIEEEEGKFLEAYAKLATRVAPVTAATLDATSRRRARTGWLGRLLGLRPVSDAQRLVTWFGILAMALILLIALGEWTLTFMRSIGDAEKKISLNSVEMRELNGRLASIEKQIKMLDPTASSRPDSAAMRQSLEVQKDAVLVKLWALEHNNEELDSTVSESYRTLQRALPFQRVQLKYVIGSLGVFGSFLLPALYGALGTCAFVLRSLFREMVDRTFDGRRTGEFMVRIFLGMLSGLSLQWLVVRADGTVAGGMTPTVLAFLGGYSVEMIFAVMDRLVQVVTGRMRTPNRPGQPAARPKPGATPEGPASPSQDPTGEGPTGPKRGPAPEAPGAPRRHRGQEAPVDDVPRAA
jgi:hypothetical protein